MKASVFIATSLDGFIARKNGDVDWLGDQEEGGDDGGFGKFMKTVDALVMGRNTFEKVQSFGVWPYGSTRVVVLTNRPLNISEELAFTVETMSGTPSEVVAVLSTQGAQHLYVDGGKTIQTFLDSGAIQRIIITRLPVLLGQGIPLFGPLQQDVKLLHIETRTFENGNVQSEYEVT